MFDLESRYYDYMYVCACVFIIKVYRCFDFNDYRFFKNKFDEFEYVYKTF